MRNYSAFKSKREIPISTSKLEEHFEDHFKNRPITIPDEVANPQNYPHLKPPEHLCVVDESPPSSEEIQKARKKMKNGRCKDSDNIFAEHIKYNDSPTLISLIIMLMTLIWNVYATPKSWLHSIITFLFKNKGSKMEASN